MRSRLERLRCAASDDSRTALVERATNGATPPGMQLLRYAIRREGDVVGSGLDLGADGVGQDSPGSTGGMSGVPLHAKNAADTGCWKEGGKERTSRNRSSGLLCA